MLLREIILTDSDFLYDLYLKREKRDIQAVHTTMYGTREDRD